LRAKAPTAIISRILPAFLAAFFCVFVIFAQAPGEAPARSFGALAKDATEAREGGKTEEAIRAYQEALRLQPDWAEGWWYLGTLLYDGDRYAQAIASFQKLLQLAPQAGPAWNFLGLCEYETKDYGNALEHLTKGLSIGDADDPEISPVSKYHLALLLNRSGRFEEAASLLAAAFGESQISPQVKVALGLALLRVPLLPEEVDPSKDALIRGAGEAEAELEQKDSEKAFHVFVSLLKTNSSTPYLHYAYGKALASAARDEDALAQQQEEIRISPTSALPWIEMSQLQLHLHHPKQAVQAATEAVKLEPNSSTAHRALGEALQALGESERAAEELNFATKPATEKPPRDETIVSLYGLQPALVRTERVSPEAANSTTGLSPASFEELVHQAAAAQAEGKTDLAMESYQQALQLRPDWEEGRWRFAMLCYSTGHFPEAIAELKILSGQKPNLGTAWAVMGLAEFALEDYDNALIHLQRGEQLGFGGSAEAVRLAKYQLAILLNRSGQFDEAIGVLAGYFAQAAMDKEMRIALGMAQLRIPMLPGQLEPAKSALVESVGDATVLLLGSKYDLAFPKLQQLLKEYPATPFLHYTYGTALMALSEYDEAEAQQREESRISPRSELPYVGLASIALKRQRPSDAKAAAQRAVELAPQSAETHYLLGRACLDTGHEEQAVHELEAASKLAPGSPKVHFNLAKAYAKAKRPEKAEEERAIFDRLNALAEEERSRTGSQAYGAAHGAMDVTPAPAETNKIAPPPHP
jgi:tetratricopeptide (TPR) repeat protein